MRLLILGAHPDDAEFHAGGLATRQARLGATVKMVSVTNGGAGHHRYASEELVAIRRKEAAAAGEVIGAEYVTWDFPDGSLQPTLAVRERIITEIRQFRPDLVLTHRPNDYHPDHRAVGQAVQDASYMVTVPLVVPDVPFLRHEPVVAYMNDHFTRPAPFQPHVVLDVSTEVDSIVHMLACHESQVFDFLPYNELIEDTVPTETADRNGWLKAWFLGHAQWRNERFESPTKSAQPPTLLEAFEISEYAGAMDASRMGEFFPEC